MRMRPGESLHDSQLPCSFAQLSVAPDFSANMRHIGSFSPARQKSDRHAIWLAVELTLQLEKRFVWQIGMRRKYDSVAWVIEKRQSCDMALALRLKSQKCVSPGRQQGVRSVAWVMEKRQKCETSERKRSAWRMGKQRTLRLADEGVSLGGYTDAFSSNNNSF